MSSIDEPDVGFKFKYLKKIINCTYVVARRLKAYTILSVYFFFVHVRMLYGFLNNLYMRV